MNESEERADRRMSFWGYVLINGIVWIYALCFVVLSRILLKDSIGIGFVSIALPVGFALVSAFDFLYDRLMAGSD